MQRQPAVDHDVGASDLTGVPLAHQHDAHRRNILGIGETPERDLLRQIGARLETSSRHGAKCKRVDANAVRAERLRRRMQRQIAGLT